MTMLLKWMKTLYGRIPGRRPAGKGFIPEYISNDELTLGMIPPRRAPWQDIVRFSLTFNGYRKGGAFNRCEQVPASRDAETLSELRECLFSELKCMNRQGKRPDRDTREFIYSLLDRMRDRVAGNERD